MLCNFARFPARGKLCFGYRQEGAVGSSGRRLPARRSISKKQTTRRWSASDAETVFSAFLIIISPVISRLRPSPRPLRRACDLHFPRQGEASSAIPANRLRTGQVHSHMTPPRPTCDHRANALRGPRPVPWPRYRRSEPECRKARDGWHQSRAVDQPGAHQCRGCESLRLTTPQGRVIDRRFRCEEAFERAKILVVSVDGDGRDHAGYAGFVGGRRQ